MFEYNREGVKNRIKFLRVNLEMTFKEFSKYMEIPISTISSWEREISIPRPHYLRRLAEKNSVSEKWILFGDIKDYVQDLFDYLDLSSKVSEDVLFEIVDILKESNFEVGNFNQFEEVAKQIIDNYDELILDENDVFIPYIKPERIASEFNFLKDVEVQRVYLTLLNDLLSEDNKSKNGHSILFLLDSLSRMNSSTKPLLKRVLRDLNWLLSNNLFRFERGHQSSIPAYGSMNSSKVHDEETDREHKDIEKDMKQIIQEISIRLKDIVEINYEEYLKK